MKTTKNRLFKILATVMLLIIMAFAVTGCIPDNTRESAETLGTDLPSREAPYIPLIEAEHTETTVTVHANFNCDVNITIEVVYGQQEHELTKLISLNEGETKELTINDFAPDYYSDEAIITHVSGSASRTAPIETEEIWWELQ